MRQMFVLLFATFAVATTSFADKWEPPQNPYLADSPWPMSHRNSYNQHSSPFPGPKLSPKMKSPADLKFDFLDDDPVSITYNFTSKNTSGHYSIWGNTKHFVYKIDANNGAWELSKWIEKEIIPTRRISGAYTVLDNEGRYYVPSDDSVTVYTELEPGEPTSPIYLSATLSIPEKIEDGERIIGINMTYDGYIAVVTNRGLLSVFNRATREAVSLRIADAGEVSNSLATDEDGGIYVLGDSKLFRVNWDGKNLKPVWQVEYPTTSEPLPGRLGPGSGTTPSLMGFGKQDKLIIIADGQEKMHLLAYWRDQIPNDAKKIDGADPRLAGDIEITFGFKKLERAITEQSVLVRGYGALVVNNDYGKRKTGAVANYFTILNSNKPGIAPYGMEKFEWNDTENRWEKRWANNQISSPNGIPCMSAETNLVYHVGQFQTNWTFEGVDWNTGDLVIRYPLTPNKKYNSYYAATEVGYDQSIVSGTYGGGMRLKSP